MSSLHPSAVADNAAARRSRRPKPPPSPTLTPAEVAEAWHRRSVYAVLAASELNRRLREITTAARALLAVIDRFEESGAEERAVAHLERAGLLPTGDADHVPLLDSLSRAAGDVAGFRWVLEGFASLMLSQVLGKPLDDELPTITVNVFVIRLVTPAGDYEFSLNPSDEPTARRRARRAAELVGRIGITRGRVEVVEAANRRRVASVRVRAGKAVRS